MRSSLFRILIPAAGLLTLLLALLYPTSTSVAVEHKTIPDQPVNLINGEFECFTGFYSTTNPNNQVIRLPAGWNVSFIDGAPETNSTRREVTRNCDQSTGQHIEKLGGLDSWIIKSQNIESSPAPGKPFDLALHQQVTATIGGAYSLSGWMVSLCGGSATPNDCPQGYYIAKLLGIDPTGGIDPLAESVIWVENRRAHDEMVNGERAGWQNLYTSTVALSSTITVFARVTSPFQWHGNHAFVDSFSLVRSPAATLSLPAAVNGAAAIIIWDARQSPDVAAIPGGNYHVYVDIQYRHRGAETWIDWVTDHEGSGSQVFTAKCVGTTYEFRIRPRTIQPEGVPGAFPTQRFFGVWSEAVPLRFDPISAAGMRQQGDHLNWLPLVTSYREC
jgi:hypothetical protein